MFEIEEVKGQNAKIKVVGIGGAGGNAINNMIASNLHGVEFIAINTDLQVLDTSLASVKIQVGKELTRGLGAGSNPEIGRQAAIEDRAAIMECLDGCDMVFIRRRLRRLGIAAAARTVEADGGRGRGDGPREGLRRGKHGAEDTGGD